MQPPAYLNLKEILMTSIQIYTISQMSFCSICDKLNFKSPYSV